MPFRAVYVHCKVLNQGFLTSLAYDDRLLKLYEQVEEVLLKDRPYELVAVELTESLDFDNWTLPGFLRMKNLVLDDPLYVRAVVRKKGDKSELPSWKTQMKDSITPKKRSQKEQPLVIKAKKSKGSEKSPTPKLLSPGPSNDVQPLTKAKQKKKKKKQVASNGAGEESPNQETEQCKRVPSPSLSEWYDV